MRLSKTAAFYLPASILLSFLAGSSAPTPLYAVYQAAWGFSPVTTTVVFGVYALAVLAALLVAGSLSDHVGRRPVLFAGAVLQAAAMAIFATAHGVGALIAARVVQGVATGASSGAAGAAMIDLDRDRGATANSVGSLLGTATGALVSGLFVQFLPAPTKLVYLLLGVVFVGQAIGIAAMPETAKPRPGALASLRPHFRVPAVARGAVIVATPALVGAWALAGFYGSLGPTLVRRLAGSPAPALGGLALCVLAAGGAAAVLLTRARPPRVSMVLGTGALVVGVGVTLFAIEHAWLAGFFAGTAVAGAGFGCGFQGAIRSVVAVAPAEDRAGVLSVLLIISYLAMGLPAVLGGVRLVHGGGILGTAHEYGLAVMALAAVALAGTLLGRAGESEARVRTSPALGVTVPPRSS